VNEAKSHLKVIDLMSAVGNPMRVQRLIGNRELITLREQGKRKGRRRLARRTLSIDQGNQVKINRGSSAKQSLSR